MLVLVVLVVVEDTNGAEVRTQNMELHIGGQSVRVQLVNCPYRRSRHLHSTRVCHFLVQFMRRQLY